MSTLSIRRSLRLRRALALLLASCMLVSQACVPVPGPEPRPGLLQASIEAVRTIGPVRVHLDTGNLSIDRVDLGLDTRLGLLEHGAVYNSATGRWLWRHEISLLAGVFVDPTGAEHDVGALADGGAIPGTTWVKLDARRLRTKGGLVHVFDVATGRLERVHWADGAFPELRYVAQVVAGQLRTTRIEQCTASDACTEQLRFVHDAEGCLREARDRAGRVAEHLAGPGCRTETARDALSVERAWPGHRYEYGGAGRLRAVLSPEGERTEVEHLSGRVARVRRVGAGDPTYGFEWVGDAATGRTFTFMATPRAGLWRFEFDAQGRLERTVSPEGDVTRQGWQGARPSWRSDAAGGTWQFWYQDDDLVRVEDPLGHAHLIQYAPWGVNRARPDARPVRQIRDSLGLREQLDYDADGRLVGRRDGIGEYTAFTWDELGALASVTWPDGRTTSFFDHGEHGHATRIERGELSEHLLFDAVGNLEKSHDIAGELAPGRPGLIQRRFDAGRHVSEIWLISEEPDRNQWVVQKTFVTVRSDGQPLRIDRPYGATIEYEYDALGRRTARREKVDGQWRTTLRAFDPEGRLTRTEQPNGMTSELEYDRDGHLVALRRSHVGAAFERVDFAWMAGRLVRIDDIAHPQPELLEYDAAGRVRAVAHATGGVSEFDWDGRGRSLARRVRASAAGPVLFEVTRSWDVNDRVLRSELDGELLVERQYAAGRLVSERFGNGLTRDYEYDAELGELVRSVMQRGAQTIEDTRIDRVPCWSEALCFDVFSTVDFARAGAAPSYWGVEEHYQLRWPEQVMGEVALPGPRLRQVSGDPIETLTDGDRLRFDALGNLSGYTPRGSAERSFVFNAERNRLLSGGIAGDHSFTYDAAGFVTERDGVAYGWSAAGLIARVGPDLRFEWDGLGRPVSRTLGGEQVRFGFGGSVVVDENGWPIETEIDGVRISLGAATRQYAHRDFRGNVQLVTDEQGDVVRRHLYTAFGTRRVDEPGNIVRAPRDGERGFANGMHMGDLQLVGARLYDPDTARFMSPDPIEHVLNDFAYTTGDPVRFWDPGGTAAIGTPGAGDLDGLTPMGRIVVVTGQASGVIGEVLAAAGMVTGNPVLVAVGTALSVLGAVIVNFGTSLKDEPMPGGRVDAVPPSDLETTGVETSPSVCAPEHLAPGRVDPRQLALLAAALAVALWLARRERRTG